MAAKQEKRKSTKTQRHKCTKAQMHKSHKKVQKSHEETIYCVDIKSYEESTKIQEMEYMIKKDKN